jgi:hypothetical protein
MTNKRKQPFAEPRNQQGVTPSSKQQFSRSSPFAQPWPYPFPYCAAESPLRATALPNFASSSTSRSVESRS